MNRPLKTPYQANSKGARKAELRSVYGRRPQRTRFLIALAFFVADTGVNATPHGSLGGHVAQFDNAGRLRPWVAWNVALDREMRFYATCPIERGYPRFATETFLRADWTPDPARRDTIPATQDGMGIISYLKFRALYGDPGGQYLETARALGNFLMREALTPDTGRYPAFPRSTGTRGERPLAPDSGSEADRPYEIEPDKGGIAGYALVLLSDADGDRAGLNFGVQVARVLAANQITGDGMHSPFPFRVDYRDGTARGAVSGNMTYILRLYDLLLARGYSEFAAPRAALWRWIRYRQIPSAAGDGALFAQFFEDHDTPTNRTAWAPLNLARYLLERRAELDPNWRRDAGVLIHFVRHTFTHHEAGVTVCHEQDEDRDAWGGVNATYGAVLAMYAKAIDSAMLAEEARTALTFTLYAIDESGRPRDLVSHDVPGGWQEDAHTDVIHNYVDALRAFPSWGR